MLDIRKDKIIPALIIFSLFFYNLLFAQDAAVNYNELEYSVEIIWNTDAPSTSQVEFGESEGDYRYKTQIDQSLVTSHKALLKGLKPATFYHYRVRSRDSLGNEVVSRDFTLMAPDHKNTKMPIEISDVKASNIIAAAINSSGREVDYEDKRELLMAKELSEKKASFKDQSQGRSGSLASKEEPIERSLIERGGLLLAKNKLQLEPSFTYAHISANKIAIQGFAILPILVVGQISSEAVKRDIFITAASLRYGLLDNLQWNLKVPFRTQHERISNTPAEEFTRSAYGLGDIETGLFYQLLYEKGSIPGLIGGINLKTNTGRHPYGRSIGLGTGHWGVKPSLVWVKSSDPAILFGSLGYTWNMKRDINLAGFGKVDPGDTFDYSLGVAFALNYQTALNFQIEQSITDKLRINDNPVPRSFVNSSSFKAGFTYSISKNLALDVVTSYGLSEDAPDFTLEVRLPYTF